MSKLKGTRCEDCVSASINSADMQPHLCRKHEWEVESERLAQEETMIVCKFLDPDKPDTKVSYLNTLLVDPKDKFETLLEHIQAEEFEGRSCVLSLTTKVMTVEEIEAMPEWEP